MSYRKRSMSKLASTQDLRSATALNAFRLDLAYARRVGTPIITPKASSRKTLTLK